MQIFPKIQHCLKQNTETTKCWNYRSKFIVEVHVGEKAAQNFNRMSRPIISAMSLIVENETIDPLGINLNKF